MSAHEHVRSDITRSLPLICRCWRSFTFFSERPQQQRAKQLRQTDRQSRRGDTVVTAGGIVGRVVKASSAEDPEILVEIADNVQVKVLKSTLSDVRPRAQRPSGEELTCCRFLSGRASSVALMVLAGVLIALPNALPDKVLSRYPASCRTSTVSLGLDLQGGSYLLLEVDFDQVQKDKAESDDRRYPRRFPQSPYPVSPISAPRAIRSGARQRPRALWPKPRSWCTNSIPP